MSTTPNATASWKPSFNPWAIALTVTIATFMEVLDSSIANVALPHIAGTLGASTDESTWVLTSYLVANAIILPISAWLSRVIGRKRFYMGCVLLFTTSSFLCGFAPTLGTLIFFRVLQGLGGGGLAPSEQAILADTFSPAQRGMAFAVYGMAVVVAPAVGPTLGGWITDNYSWRWIFYINIPFGILSLFLSQRLVEDPPYLKEESARAKGAKVDWTGLGLIALAMATLQIALDKGQQEDWFASPWINAALITFVIALATWIWWEWRHPDPIVDIKLFRNRNFAAAMFFTFVLGIVLYGTTVVIPQFLQLQLGYSAVKAGEALAGGGIVMIFMMPIAGALIARMDPRIMMGFGFAVTAWALSFMASHLSLEIDFAHASMLRTFQMLGLAFVFIPSSTLAYVGVAREKNNQVSAMNAFVRNVGGSIGIALITTFITRLTQKHQTILVSHATPGNPNWDQMLAATRASLEKAGVSTGDAAQQAYSRLMMMIQGQATTLAYIDVVYILTGMIACLVPLVMIMRRPPKHSAADDIPVH